MDQRVSAFGGGEDEDVKEFLWRFEQRVFQQDRISLRSPPSFLTGQSLDFWKVWSPAIKASYDLVIATLRRRFLGPIKRAVDEMNNLQQGYMTSVDYVQKAIQLYLQLGDDYSEWLAVRFMDGLQDTELWDTIDSQAKGPLTFPDILRFCAGTLIQKLKNEQVELVQMIGCNQQIDFSTQYDSVHLRGEPGSVSSHPPFIPFATVPKVEKTRGEPKPMKLTKVVQSKQHPKTMAEMLAEVVQ